MTTTPPEPLRLCALRDIPAIEAGDDLAEIFSKAAEKSEVELRNGVLVVCQKVISKAEGQIVRLADVQPRKEAMEIAKEHDKDPRQVEVVLQQTRRIVRRGNGVLICETHHGFVCANAGVDLSNAPGDDVAVLLPKDPDASAARLRTALRLRQPGPLGVVVSDTFGRPWREGLVDVALGSAGFAPIDDIRGQTDWTGRELAVTTNAAADQLAAAAGMLMLKDAGIPAVWIEGYPLRGEGRVKDTLRDPEKDLFR